jgi:hypothetical protein
MKKILYIALVLPLVLISCQKTPEALFSIDSKEVEVGKDVEFVNQSQNAVEFEWDFGDGTKSAVKHPVHAFTGSGSYVVKLTAISKNGLEDNAELTVDVMIPTLLEIEVREYYDQYAVADASVLLYGSLTAWDNQANVEATGTTDKDGLVVFSGLGPWIYYVDVWKKNYNNYSLRVEDVGFIRTSEVLPHKINRFVAWVDYVVASKGDGRRVITPVIRKVERKVTERTNYVTNLGTEGWKDLYARSIKAK